MCRELVLLIEIYLIFFQYFYAVCLHLTTNCDNTLDLHSSLRGYVNREVIFKEATQATIKVLMYIVSSGRIRVGKEFDEQMISSEYENVRMRYILTV